VVGGLTIHLPVANFLRFIYAKNYENWLRVGKIIAKKAVCSFFGPPCIFDMPWTGRWMHTRRRWSQLYIRHVPSSSHSTNEFPSPAVVWK